MLDKDVIGLDGPAFKVGVVPLPGFALMSYACTVEPLRAANLLSKRPLYDITHFLTAPEAASSGAAKIERQESVGAAVDLDLLLVVAGGDPFASQDKTLKKWLGQIARSGVLIGGVSGGPVVLAEAGLMAGRRMTVHWEHAAQLAERHPDTLIERRLYVADRDRITCGGGTAPLDMMHALLSEHHGRVFARLVSDWFLHTEIRAAAAPQRSGMTDRAGSHSLPLTTAVSAMEDHIADPLSLSQLALMAGVTDRHLNRLFTDGLGVSAMHAYRQLRLDVAKRLVDGSAMSIAEIAEATGFANAAHLSNAYLKQFGLRPFADRRKKPQTAA